MDAAQVFGRLISVEGVDVHSDKTNRTEQLHLAYLEEFQKTLSKQQNDMYFHMDTLNCCLDGEYFNDGVLYGLQLAKAMREMLDDPEKAFLAFQKQGIPFDNAFEKEIAYLREYQNRKQAAC